MLSLKCSLNMIAFLLPFIQNRFIFSLNSSSFSALRLLLQRSSLVPTSNYKLLQRQSFHYHCLLNLELSISLFIMANLPRFGRAWQRISAARPAPAAAQPASEPEPEILSLAPTTQSLQPFEPNPPPVAAWISSPAKKALSPAVSPKYNATVTRVASPPVSPSRKSPDRRHSISPNSYQKTVKPTTPPLSPLALPKSANVTAIQSRILPEVEKKIGPYKKPVEKVDRQTEYGSGKPPQKAEAINLAGHNVGAVMEVKQFSDKRGGEVIKKIETESDVRHGNDEGKTAGAKEKGDRATGFPMTPYMNSNFQEVNNSVMYSSSCSGRDPGLHLDFSGESKDDGAIVDGGEKSKY